jgi:hypothetical protein
MPTEQEFQDAKKNAEERHKASSGLKEIGRAIAIDVGPKISGDVTNPDERCLRFYVERKIRPMGRSEHIWSSDRRNRDRPHSPVSGRAGLLDRIR